METKVSYTVAGLFVTGLIFAIVVAVIWLTSGLDAKEFTYYTVYMNESVSGLSNEGPVEFNGVNVGTVEKMIINRQNPQLVELLLKVEQGTPVTFGTKAKLGMRALSGIAYILLEDHGTDMRPLVAEAGIPYPVIPTTPSILVRLDTTLTQLTDSFRQVSTSIRSLLDEENLRAFKELLSSGKKSIKKLEVQTIPGTNRAIDNFNNLTQEISEISTELKQDPSVIIRGKSTLPGPGER